MSALKIDSTLSDIEKNMMALAPNRKPELFNKFLLQGYTAITLSSVPSSSFMNLLRAKLCLGTFITLYDDFADLPYKANPKLLESLYRLRFRDFSLKDSNNMQDVRTLNFAQSLFAQMQEVLEVLPHYTKLCDILDFDLTQFYSANQFSSLVTAHPHLNNQLENQIYTHHNMGMVMVGMMDLMAIKELHFYELSAIRTVLLIGQRMGRIFNVLTTFERETVEGDLTSELSICDSEIERDRLKLRLQQEVHILGRRIQNYDNCITTFSTKAYLRGLMKVESLHRQMKGLI